MRMQSSGPNFNKSKTLESVSKLITNLAIILFLSSCSFESSNEGFRPRTQEENQAITDSWYPIKSEECQILVDVFRLISAAIGSDDTGYLFDNQEEIENRLRQTSEVSVTVLSDLYKRTSNKSIREYAFEAIPIFSQLHLLVAQNEIELEKQESLLLKLSEITGKVPNACRS